MSQLRRRLMQWLRPLSGTPLHPQWLVLRHRAVNDAWVARHATGRVLDVGCGDARLRRILPPELDYIGMDYPGTVALGYEGARDLYGDAQAMPLAAASLDTVLLLDVLEHLPEPERALGEMARVLRPGGRCLIHVPFYYPVHDAPHDYRRWTRFGLAALLAGAGFEIASVEETADGVESAAGGLAMALAAGAIEALRARHPAALLLPFILVAVPVVNVFAYFFGRMLPATGLMPYGYRVLAARPAS